MQYQYIGSRHRAHTLRCHRDPDSIRCTSAEQCETDCRTFFSNPVNTHIVVETTNTTPTVACRLHSWLLHHGLERVRTLLAARQERRTGVLLQILIETQNAHHTQLPITCMHLTIMPYGIKLIFVRALKRNDKSSFTGYCCIDAY